MVCKSSAPIITLSPLNIKVNTLQNTRILFPIIFFKAFFNGFIDDDGTGGEKLRGKCEWMDRLVAKVAQQSEEGTVQWTGK